MKLRRVRDGAALAVEIAVGDAWVNAGRALSAARPALAESDIALWARDTVAFLGAPDDVRARAEEAARGLAPEADGARTVALPFAPLSFRDFMLYEAHAIGAARGFVRMSMPALWPIVRGYERVLGAPFPLLKPHRLWYRQPIYYMGNHLAFAGDGEDIAIPRYATALDYELELGLVLQSGLFNADPEEAEAAIGGFVVVNDFSARNVQREEMASGFGPQKSKHFRNGLSGVVVSADEIVPRWQSLRGTVRINGALVAETSTAGPRWSLGEMLAHASRCEQLYPGELFATGTLPGGSGIESGRLLDAGDAIEIAIEGIGRVRNSISREGQERP
ncbi:MAG: fumarylacetoacetate hydrolase family protein [Hyphomicrobium sp.]|uniref:fumarylacetoacetate hydrolase family protein n=1 Tax=Hyphomicrobium sp. TaxID=82 RepID=UPI003D0BACA9